ncbi:MAG: hypothetical protein FJ308_21805 [Planctomycetes bacterium]|nr:hypothetical protein [Planctomycetota bacterium]
MSDSRFGPDDLWDGVGVPESELADSEAHNVEAKLKNARDYVRPSESLRSKVLCKAREIGDDWRADRKLYNATIAIAGCLFLMAITVKSLESWWMAGFQRGSSEEIVARAERLAAERNLRHDDSLIEAYREWQVSMASNLPKVDP